MKKRDDDSPIDLLGGDLEAMRELQRELDRVVQDTGAGRALEDMSQAMANYRQIQRQALKPLREIEEMHREALQPLEQIRSQTLRLQESMSPDIEKLAPVVGDLDKVTAAVADMTRPFDLDVMANLMDGIVPKDRLGEYLDLFDFEGLCEFVHEQPQVTEPKETREEQAEDRIELEPRVEIHVISAISDALIEHLRRHPEEMRRMQPRLFEELVAELIEGQGFTVELTRQTRDGGYDIVAVNHELSTTRHLIECKRYAEGRPVSVQAVRSLYGVVTGKDASQGIIVTTSRLSRDAAVEIDQHPWRLGKAEYADLKRWIIEHLKNKR